MKKLEFIEIFNEFEISLGFETAFLNKETGEVEMFMDEEWMLSDASEEEVEEFNEEKKQIYDKIRDIEENYSKGKYIRLPTKFEVHEWEIMKDFCYTVEDEEKRHELLNAIHGSGAFRMFKNFIHRFEITDEWYQFREKFLKNILREWLEVNNIEFEENGS